MINNRSAFDKFFEEYYDAKSYTNVKEMDDYIVNDLNFTKTILNSVYGRAYDQTVAETKVVKPAKVIFNDPATIVFWNDRTKTVVKCRKEDVYDPEKGLAMAIAKKALGNKGNYCNEFKKWLPKEEPNSSVDIKVDDFSNKLTKDLKSAINSIFGREKK